MPAPVNTKRFAAIMLLAGTASLAACSKKAPEELPPPPAGTGVVTNMPAIIPDSALPAVGSQTHFENAINGQNVIYFDTDSFSIDSEDASALQSQAKYLNQYGGVTITVEGHADERGTREYNLALGERRANAAKNYLVSLGIPTNRISTVSYGKERPAALGSDQESWALNRRAVSVVIQ